MQGEDGGRGEDAGGGEGLSSRRLQVGGSWRVLGGLDLKPPSHSVCPKHWMAACHALAGLPNQISQGMMLGCIGLALQAGLVAGSWSG